MVLGCWSPVESQLLISLRELHVVEFGLQSFQDHLRGLFVAIFCNNVVAISDPRKSGSSRLALPNEDTQEVLHWV